MPRRERPLDAGDDAVVRFAGELRSLREKAGGPTYRELSKRAHYSVTALSEAANGRRLPSLAVTLAYVTACGGDAEAWETTWRSVAAESTEPPDQQDTTAAPYVGLAAFQSTDADRFFGRERLVEELSERVCRHRFLGVFGASGSGKSSVLRAGLLARAGSTGLSGRGAQPALVFTPGPHPVEECAVHFAALTGESATALRAEFATDRNSLHLRIRQALAARHTDEDLLLVVDQFEEVFTLCQDRDERAAFVAVLVTAATAATSRVRVVLGVRADFYGHCGEHPALVEALRDAQVLVGPLTTDELRNAISRPAARAGCTVETSLVARLVADAAGQPAVLPLVSHALLETWRRRRGVTLSVAGYEEAGGIQHAIARSAEDVYTGLEAAEQRVARLVLLRLVAIGDGTEDTRRRVERRELDTVATNAGAVVEKLTRARLLTVDQDSVEIVHEALIRRWPRLHRWLAEDRNGLRVHRQLTEASVGWRSLGWDPGALYRGVRLAVAQDWAAANDDALTGLERRFLAASLAARATERATERRRTRRLRQLVGLLGVLLVMTGATTWYAVRARQAANAGRDTALSRTVAGDAAALRVTNPALAAQLSLAAYRLAPTAVARDSLLSTFSAPYATRLTGHTAPVTSVSISAGGQLLASADSDGTARLWDCADPNRTVEVARLDGAGSMVVISPKGNLLATVGGDTSSLWNVTDPRHPRKVANLPGHRDDRFGPRTISAAFDRDGRVLATTGTDNLARLWDVVDLEHPEELGSLVGHTNDVESVAFNPDRRTVATGSRDRTVRLWDIEDLTHPRLISVIADHTNTVTSVAFSSDGSRLATAARDHTARLWDVATRDRPQQLAVLAGHSDIVTSVTFVDQQTVATGSSDDTARLWDVTDPRHAHQIDTLTGHIDAVTAVTFNLSKQILATASSDRTIRLTYLPGPLSSHASAVTSVAFSQDGRALATASEDMTARLWDITVAHHFREITTAVGHTDAVSSVAFGPGGRLMATGGADRTARLWNTSDPAHLRQTVIPTGHTDRITAVAVSLDGRLLATASADATVRLWDITNPDTPRLTVILDEHTETVTSVAFSADGHLLATGSGDHTARLWDISSPGVGTTIATLTPHTNTVTAVAFSADGHLLATGSDDHTARLWDTTDPHAPRELGAAVGHGDSVRSVAFSPNGRTLATGSADHTARLWDVGDPVHPLVTAILTGHADTVRSVAFGRDGHTLATGSDDHTARLWDTDIERVAGHVCEIAHPRITREEWDRYFPGLPYQPPCRPDR
ncbi:nSTAND1 domain-containing NTPase [Solihabitans fulvus]|uniref:nSTAND1 domain-containing NTPase n=1 Tax=Solihabitans fulvus TaxID=1892852 RepID=UPI001CB7674D|nr:AAA family ATPase [Solihabitans fulvus]